MLLTKVQVAVISGLLSWLASSLSHAITAGHLPPTSPRMCTGLPRACLHQVTGVSQTWDRGDISSVFLYFFCKELWYLAGLWGLCSEGLMGVKQGPSHWEAG